MSGYVESVAVKSNPGDILNVERVVKPHDVSINSIYRFYIKVLASNYQIHMYSEQFTLVVGCNQADAFLTIATDPAFKTTYNSEVGVQ